MTHTITITSKGQTTLPVAIRRAFGLSSEGGTLQVEFNERKRELVITKPETIEEMSARFTSYITPGIKPVENVDAYYQANKGKYL